MRAEIHARSPHLLAAIPMACVLAVASFGIAPAVNAEGVARYLERGKIARSKMNRIKRRGRLRIHLPIGPSYTYQDYLYYYSRGYYPTNIGGYIYYPYYYYRSYKRGHGPPHRQRTHKDRRW